MHAAVAGATPKESHFLTESHRVSSFFCRLVMVIPGRSKHILHVSVVELHHSDERMIRQWHSGCRQQNHLYRMENRKKAIATRSRLVVLSPVEGEPQSRLQGLL